MSSEVVVGLCTSLPSGHWPGNTLFFFISAISAIAVYESKIGDDEVSGDKIHPGHWARCSLSSEMTVSGQRKIDVYGNVTGDWLHSSLNATKNRRTGIAMADLPRSCQTV